MQDDEFEWLDHKAAENLAKHKVSFEVARRAFKDPMALHWWDDTEKYDGEDRYAMLGIVEGRLLFVAYTIRGERYHLISARKPEPFERRMYHENEG